MTTGTDIDRSGESCESAGAAVLVGQADAARNTLVLNSQQLFRGQKAVVIEHNGSMYRLQATRQGKLILTK